MSCLALCSMILPVNLMDSSKQFRCCRNAPKLSFPWSLMIIMSSIFLSHMFYLRAYHYITLFSKSKFSTLIILTPWPWSPVVWITRQLGTVRVSCCIINYVPQIDRLEVKRPSAIFPLSAFHLRTPRTSPSAHHEGRDTPSHEICGFLLHHRVAYAYSRYNRNQ